jgi:co-chaperonin GroES (HSP10)
MGKIYDLGGDTTVSKEDRELVELGQKAREEKEKTQISKSYESAKTEDEQYKYLLETTPDYVTNQIFYGDRVIVRLIKKEKVATSGLFIPDVKLVPSASELKKNTQLTPEDEQYLYRGVVVAVGQECKYPITIGTVVELNRAMQPVQLASFTLKFKNFAGNTEHENLYSLPSGQITSSWKTSEAYLDFLKKHRKNTD